ncbi:MAG TPA: PilZ domain-containing protein [Planctomycetota bacterium]|nr:PilZ domain-containing protein [Planctomycetota bacterium]
MSEPLNEGDTLTVELRDRRSGESFRARGEVRWCETLLSGAGHNHFVGVQFKEHYSPVEVRDKFTLGAVRLPGSAPGAAGDKRRALRFRVEDYVVTCLRQGTLSGQGLKRNIAREVLDLSTTGVQLNVTEKLETGALVLFNFQLNTFPDGLESLAACRWCRPDPGVAGTSYRVGLEFVRLPDDRRRMIEFVRNWFEKRRARR